MLRLTRYGIVDFKYRLTDVKVTYCGGLVKKSNWFYESIMRPIFIWNDKYYEVEEEILNKILERVVK